METSIYNLDAESATFIWSHIFIDFLVEMPRSDGAMSQMMQECYSRYENDKAEKRKLDEFQRTYTPSLAIKYYTRDSCLFRLLNEAIRKNKLYDIIKFRLFIRDIYNQLKQLQESSTNFEHQ